MEAIQKIAVIGGGGRTGKYIVDQLLQKGFSLRLLLRNPNTFTIQDPLIEIIHGDVLDEKIVNVLIEGCQAVISTVGQRKDEPLVASRGAKNVISAIQKQQISAGKVRYILLAGLNVDTLFDKKSPETQKATAWMKETFPAIHEDRQKSYAILEASDVDWTLVRVPCIEFSDEKGNVKVDPEDCPGSKISAGDIARFMIGQLMDNTYLRQAPFIAGF
ncbi:NAD(P)-dependent oxidoreductase [Dyadobacter pollutisoli]|jgi:putative NADH-flavin reductase|uniref:NAD(P)H-binding protein n=1 Tax=Dyadobacter pollutisoli TaxID=2910158 RepID=A0A9E8N995_9BACT|nr:NAD(P)H-binding protein [Dyadobacter pollutisoli]WAC10224.1 NAD(P)H-binding protein [Dyadobacter pollutisoli]